MALVIPKETYSGKIYNVQLGTGAKAVTIGGANALPYPWLRRDVPEQAGRGAGSDGHRA